MHKNEQNRTTFKGTTAVVYDRILRDNPHILIAGTTGAGKSTVEQGFINSMLYLDPLPRLYLIDPKCVDLFPFARMRNVRGYADDPQGAKALLSEVCEIMEARYKRMRAAGQTQTTEPPIFVIIDELADIVLQDKTIFEPLQRILGKGRAASCRVLMCTQLVNAQVLPTLARANASCTIGLRCESAHASRLLIGRKGCEDLPRYGEAITKSAEGYRRERLPMIPRESIEGIIKFWS